MGKPHMVATVHFGKGQRVTTKDDCGVSGRTCSDNDLRFKVKAAATRSIRGGNHARTGPGRGDFLPERLFS